MSKYLPAQWAQPAGILAFTLSHEIGHGQLRHRERSSATGVVVAIILALLVLTPLAIHLKRQPRGTPTWRFVMWALVFLASLFFAFTIVNPKAQFCEHRLRARGRQVRDRQPGKNGLLSIRS
ncbi:hypothetical protein LP420_06595 [Massilia sp. B-10]|nr:hypothetical protein LP420_06595 [Massilia sp. B-10]